MSLKDLFESSKVLQSTSLDDISKEVESKDYIESFQKDKVRFVPNIDYSDPKNFAFYGSAEKYYSDAFKRIRTLFPYDGSEKEKIDWLNESTYLDLYIFEHEYPRFNGYVDIIPPSDDAWAAGSVSNYGKPNAPSYIKTIGGPHASDKSGLPNQFDDANKYDESNTRQSNLDFNLNNGVTVEMWLKKPAFVSAKTKTEVLFDLWNGELSGSSQWGRFRFELDATASASPFLITAQSGTSGMSRQQIGSNLTHASITDWTHVVVSLKNSASDIKYNLYINGKFNQSGSFAGAALEAVTGSLISSIGALQHAPSGNAYNSLNTANAMQGYGQFSGSIDDFRFWKTERTSKEIGRYYWTHLGGGTNTDIANTKLGVYYKFNEGITETDSIDSAVLDYSGRLSNGTWTGYVSGVRHTGSAMVLAGKAAREFKDPTIYSSHADYITTLSKLESSGSVYDIQNNSALFHTMPQWILDDDDVKEGNLRNLTQIMGSYFDNLQLQIKAVSNLKDIYSHFQTETMDLNDVTSTSGSVKPLPFADRLLTNAAFIAPEIFADATILESLATRTEDEDFFMKLSDVKNQIYQNVYANLTNIYKNKGTKKAFRNVLHAFGIDESIVKINFYGDNVDFELKDKYSTRSIKEKFVDFNGPDRFAGSIYQYADSGTTNSISFISGSAANFEKYIPITFETQIILPDKIPWHEVGGFNTSFTKSVIAGMHEADPTDGTNFTIPAGDKCDIQMYVERDELESKRVKFHLKSTALDIDLESDLYYDQYKNNEWFLAFRLKNEKYGVTDVISDSTTGTDYVIEFLGYNTVENIILNSFTKTATVTSAKALDFLKTSKRIYAGARLANFTGGVQEQTDIKTGIVRYWMNYLSDDTIKMHAYDSTSYGTGAPFRSAYLMEDSVNDIKIPEIDTLLLSWDFNTLSTTDANKQFIVPDVTSGSGETRYVQAFEDIKRKAYTGRGLFPLANDEKAIDVEYLSIARSTYPEILHSDDMIEIRKQDDIVFTKETLPVDYYIAFEKSMAQTISEEMIKFMSSITAFNDLIGRPVDKYREEYKDLSKLRQLFFERISNEPDLDKYIDYYKWLDDSLGDMLVALVPASLKHSDGINNVVENHLFSRDKYENKYPTFEFKISEPEGGMNTINRHLYPWKTGHAPNPLEEDDNCFWWLERAERDKPPLSPVSPSDLPSNTIYITSTGEVWYNFASDIYAFQFKPIGGTVTGIFPGDAQSSGLTVSVHIRTDIIIATSSNNSYVPAGSGVLFNIIGFTGNVISLNNVSFTGANSTSISVTLYDISSGTSLPLGVVNTRIKVFQARNSILNRSYTTAQHFDMNKVRNLHGGTNYDEHKKRQFVFSAARPSGETPLTFGQYGGFPLRYILANSDSFRTLNDCDDPRPTTEKLKMAFGAIDGMAAFEGYMSGTVDGVYKGAILFPFNIMSSSVDSGYTKLLSGVGSAGFDNIDIVNVHSDTVDETDAVPMQGPFTETWVGGHQSRHAPLNLGDDAPTNRVEAYRILLRNILNASGSIGIVGPDYPYETGPYPNISFPQAKYFREEKVKRPVNIKNIQTTTAVAATMGNPIGGVATLYFGSTTSTDLANSIRTLFTGDISDRFDAWTVGAVGTVSGGKGFTITAPANGIQYNFSNINSVEGSVGDEIIASTVNGTGGSKTTYSARVMTNYSTIPDDSTLAFDVDTDGTGGSETFTLTLKTGTGSDSTGWVAASTSVTAAAIKDVVGNYKKNYEVVQSAGRTQNNTGLREVYQSDDEILQPGISTSLPKTTQKASRVATTTGTKGNTMSNFHTSSLYDTNLKGFNQNANLESKTKSVISSRFSAPGSFDTLSKDYLDAYAREYSVHNALPFRNLDVRGSGSGEATTPRLIDIHGNRYGLRTHLSRHTAQFGIDSVLGGTDGAFHKTNKNPSYDPTLNSRKGTALSSAYRLDNWFAQHHIPQSDMKYQWMKNSHPDVLKTTTLRGHILTNMSEPSASTSIFPKVDYAVPSQSFLSHRENYTSTSISRLGVTTYGFPSWEEIRNNDRHSNVVLKKQFGYNYLKDVDTDTTSTVEESRVLCNIPMTSEVVYQQNNYEFKFPFVNMRYHFDSRELLEQGINPHNNTTMYKSLLGHYKNDDDVEFVKLNVKQNIYPQFIKHTKFNVRHRHYFVSHFWNPGENDVYNTDIGPASYYGTNEIGRREKNVTATLWPDSVTKVRTTILGTQTDPYDNDTWETFTTTIPSQSIWQMDGRKNFTSSVTPQVAASNSAGNANFGGPGVLQNQDHHFHNGISISYLNTSGSSATGQFKMLGATVHGIQSTGSFTVHGVTPQGEEASGSFKVRTAMSSGIQATGTFVALGQYQPPSPGGAVFTASAATTMGLYATASFDVSGGLEVGKKEKWQFTSAGQYVAGTSAVASFRVEANNQAEATSEAYFAIQGLYKAAHPTTGVFRMSGAYTAGAPATSTFNVTRIPRYGDRKAMVFSFTAMSAIGGDSAYNGSGINFPSPINQNFKAVVTSSVPSNTSTNTYIPVWNYGRYVHCGDNGTLERDDFDGFTTGEGIVISFWIRVGQTSNNSVSHNPSADGNYSILKILKGGASNATKNSVWITLNRWDDSGTTRWDLNCYRYFDNSDSKYVKSVYQDFFNYNAGDGYGNGDWWHVTLSQNDSTSTYKHWYCRVNGAAFNAGDNSHVTLTTTAVGSPSTVTAVGGAVRLGNSSGDFKLKIDELAIFDDHQGQNNAGHIITNQGSNPAFNSSDNYATKLYNGGEWLGINDANLLSPDLVTWWTFGDLLNDSAALIFDYGENNNFNHLDDNSNESDITFADRNGSYSWTNHKTDAELVEAFRLAIDSDSGANDYTVVTQDREGSAYDTIYVYASNVGTSYDFTAVELNSNLLNTFDNLTPPYFNTAASNFGYGETLTIEGSTYSVRHNSFRDDGDVYTFGGDATTTPTADKAFSTRAFHFNEWESGTNNKMYMYNANYLGLTGAWSSAIDMTLTFWHSPQVASNAQMHIINFWEDTGDLTPSTPSILVYTFEDDLYVRVFNGDGSATGDSRTYKVAACLTLDRYQHFGIVIDRGDLTVSPIVYINGESQTVTSPSGTGTGVLAYINSVFIGDYPIDGLTYEAKAYITQMAVWKITLSQAEVQEIYNKGRWKDLRTHGKIQYLNDWWQLGDDTSGGSVPASPASSGNGDTLATAGISSVTAVMSAYTRNINNLSFGTHVAGAVFLTNGIIREGKYWNGSAFITLESTNINFWNHVDTTITANSNIGSVGYTGNNASSVGQFTAFATPTGSNTNTPTVSGDTFASPTQFTGGSLHDGSHPEDFITFKNIANELYTIKLTEEGDSSVGQWAPSATKNVDLLTYTTDANLWNRVRDHIINNAGSPNPGINALSANRTESGGIATFTVISTETGTNNLFAATEGGVLNGNTFDITEQGTGGTSESGVEDEAKIFIPYCKSVDSGVFSVPQTGTFEFDTSTGGSAALDGTENTSGHPRYIPVSCTASVGSSWTSGFGITNDTSFWTHVASRIQTLTTIDSVQQYTVTYTYQNADTVNAVAVFKVKANTGQGTVYDGLDVTNDGPVGFNFPNESSPDNWIDFSNRVAPCGAVIGDRIDLDAQGTTKTFALGGSAGHSGNTRTIDVTVANKAAFWDPLKVAIKAELEESSNSTYTVAYSDSNAGNACSYATFTVTAAKTGSAYDFDGSFEVNTGPSFSNMSNTVGTNANVFDGDTITIDGDVYTAKIGSATNSGNRFIRYDQSVSTIRANLKTVIEANTTDFVVTCTGDPITVAIEAAAIGANTSFTVASSDSPTFSNESQLVDGVAPFGPTIGDKIKVISKYFVLQDGGTDNSPANYYYIAITDGSGNPRSDTDVWNDLENKIEAQCSEINGGTITRTTGGLPAHTARLSLTVNATGSAKNSWDLNDYSNSDSFDVLGSGWAGGTNRTGSVENDTIILKKNTNSSHHWTFKVDPDGSSCTTTGNTVCVDSTHAGNAATANTAWWAALKTAIEAKGFTATVTEGSGGGVNADQAKFYVLNSDTNVVVGLASNTSGDGGGIDLSPDPGGSFVLNTDGDFAGGADTSGAQPLSRIRVAGTEFLVISGTYGSPEAAANVAQVNANQGGNHFWDEIVAKIGGGTFDGTAWSGITGWACSRNSGQFTASSDATGSSYDAAVTITNNVGSTFTVGSTQTVGTNESGVLHNSTITIEGDTFTIKTDGSHSGNFQVDGRGDGTAAKDLIFWNLLKGAIVAQTDWAFTSYSPGSNGNTGGFKTFNLTHEQTGTAHHTPTWAIGGSTSPRSTFEIIEQPAGGTNKYGVEDLDYIRFHETIDDSNAATSKVRFEIKDGSASDAISGADQVRYIDISSYIANANDQEGSEDFWDTLRDKIIQYTVFKTASWGTATTTGDSHIATFSLTSSITGTAYNTRIESAVKAGGNTSYGFTIVENTQGGTDPTGTQAGDKLIFQKNTPLSNAPGTALTYSISEASGSCYPTDANSNLIFAGSYNNSSHAKVTITDADMWTNVTNAIGAQTDYYVKNNPALTQSAGYATFDLESGNKLASEGYLDPYTNTPVMTGSVMNSTLTEDNNTASPDRDTFKTLSGIAGAVDGVFEHLKHKEIITQPKYGYPHTLTSPGSLRCPTAKSSLGLMDSNYKLRSNHFSITRSLGHVTDGVYDNTARWDTPDLSTLSPYDSHYDEWYQDVRTHNKCLSLVPEFRISSYIKDILTDPQWQADEGKWIANNSWLEITGSSMDDGTSNAQNNTEAFYEEFSLSTNIRNFEGFVEDNRQGIAHKLTLKCEALMKFLPYEGFYPQTRTVQMARQFAESYALGFEAEEADPSNTNLTFPEDNQFAQSRPIYDAMCSPGILYNTIKSGIAVDFPILTTKMATASYYDPYGGLNYMIENEYFDDRLPFETLINPDQHLAKKFIVDAHPHPSSSMNLKTKWNGEGDVVYKMMMSNFLAETISFFLDGGKTSRIVSKPESQFKPIMPDHMGNYPIYRAMVKLYKSKKEHPYLEFRGIAHPDITSDDNRRLVNAPSGNTNYYLKEFGGMSNTDLDYDSDKTNYPRPQMNPLRHVESITMYSQPAAFGPPCAGGVAAEFTGLTNDVPQTGPNNNTTYMMYDSTNGYNAPFTPPYYDGEAWALLTFAPTSSGVHTLDEIISNTKVKYLRYELNHESGSFGDRGTKGPQGFAINDNAMQIDASLNILKKAYTHAVTYDSAGGVKEIDTDNRKRESIWVIESKFETPILDFSKYLNRQHNVWFECDPTLTSADVFHSSYAGGLLMTLSGARDDTPGGSYDLKSRFSTSEYTSAGIGNITELSGIMTPIGMWHQYGDFPSDNDRGIFMQITDIPADYTLYGTELTVANPKWATVNLAGGDCTEGSVGYGDSGGAGTTSPFEVELVYPKQGSRRRLDRGLKTGQDIGIFDTSRWDTTIDGYGVLGGRIQMIDEDSFEIIDSQMMERDIFESKDYNVFAEILRSATAPALFIQKAPRTVSWTAITPTAGGANQSTEAAQDWWARDYYSADVPAATNLPVPVLANNISYDTVAYPAGPLQRDGFMGAYSIGLKYFDQTNQMYQAVCGRPRGETTQPLDALTARIAYDLDTIKGVKSSTLLRAPSLRFASKLLKMIPDSPSVVSSPPTNNTTGTGTYIEELHREPLWFRGSVRYFPTSVPSSMPNYASVSDNTWKGTRQAAPASQYNYSNRPVTVRWGQYMHNEGTQALTKSLADLVGFSQEKVKMGVPAKNRMVKEAIIAIPYIALANQPREFIPLNSAAINKYLFEEGIISEGRENADTPNADVELGDSVKRQITVMQRYVLPPHVDFIENEVVSPVAMYMFEFSRIFDRQELTDIWQGVRSETLNKVKFQERSISHVLSVESLLGHLKDQHTDMNILKDIKWLVFKVKQKGNSSYTKKMSDDLGDKRFTFMQESTQSSQDRVKFGYNWPYDFFSMVESVKMSVDVEILEDSRIPSDVTVSDEPVVSLDNDFDVYSEATDSGGQTPPPDLVADNTAETATADADNVVDRATTGCVLPGTIIKTERGDIKVEDVVLGDRVYSYDFNKEEFGYYNVIDVMAPSLRYRWAELGTKKGYAIRCTEDHPLYSTETSDSKMAISGVNVGDAVYVFEDGEMIKDEILFIELNGEDVMVYNFEVEEVHSYISDGILSHNKTYKKDDSVGGQNIKVIKKDSTLSKMGDEP